MKILYGLVICFVVATAAPPADREEAKNSENTGSKIGNLDAAKAKILEQLQKPAVMPKKQPEIVRRPDHLDAVPLERDGHLNKKFRQEIILGETKIEKDNSVDQVETKMVKKHKSASESDKEKMLTDVFGRADKDVDGFLTKTELEQWIQETTLKHLDEAVEETKRVLKIIDQNGDGFATWDEYHYHFLVDNKLMHPEKAKKHDENHADLKPEDQEKIETEIEEWHEADQNPKDGHLSEAEFLAFRHPEHSQTMLNEMVKDIMRSLDQDNDGRLSEDEFVAVPKGELDNKEWEESEKAYLDQRRKEFKELIDVDGDRYASFNELLEYTNPRNVQHAKHEVSELMEAADSDRDGRLSLDEILRQKALFFGSGLMNAGKNMHDEF